MYSGPSTTRSSSIRASRSDASSETAPFGAIRHAFDTEELPRLVAARPESSVPAAKSTRDECFEVMAEVGCGVLDAVAGARATSRQRAVAIGGTLAGIAAVGLLSLTSPGGALIVIGGHGYGAYKFISGLCSERPAMNKLGYSTVNFLIAISFSLAAVLAVRHLAVKIAETRRET